MRALPRKSRPQIEICILAGGLSSRMGRDKARLQLGRRTFAGQIHSTAKQLDLPVRMIRRDLTKRCGPLGGIYTALTRTRAEAVLFLACDMPFVSAEFLHKLLKLFEKRKRLGLFTSEGEFPGFPFLLSRQALPTVKQHLADDVLSLKALAKGLGAAIYRPRSAEKEELLNINTPEEFAAAQQRTAELRSSRQRRM